MIPNGPGATAPAGACLTPFNLADYCFIAMPITLRFLGYGAICCQTCRDGATSACRPGTLVSSVHVAWDAQRRPDRRVKDPAGPSPAGRYPPVRVAPRLYTGARRLGRCPLLNATTGTSKIPRRGWHGSAAVAAALPDARLIERRGLGHAKKLTPTVIAAALTDFFTLDPDRGLKVIAAGPAAACLDVARRNQVRVVQVRRVPGQNLMETFKALPVRSRAMRKASPTSSIGSMWLSSGDTSIAASAISRTAYRNDSRPGSPWAPYAE
jgi:hypothetical protein